MRFRSCCGGSGGFLFREEIINFKISGFKVHDLRRKKSRVFKTFGKVERSFVGFISLGLEFNGGVLKVFLYRNLGGLRAVVREGEWVWIAALVFLGDNQEAFVANGGFLHEEMFFLAEDLVVFKSEFWVEDLYKDWNTDHSTFYLLRFADLID